MEDQPTACDELFFCTKEAPRLRRGPTVRTLKRVTCPVSWRLVAVRRGGPERLTAPPGPSPASRCTACGVTPVSSGP